MNRAQQWAAEERHEYVTENEGQLREEMRGKTQWIGHVPNPESFETYYTPRLVYEPERWLKPEWFERFPYCKGFFWICYKGVYMVYTLHIYQDEPNYEGDDESRGPWIVNWDSRHTNGMIC